MLKYIEQNFKIIQIHYNVKHEFRVPLIQIQLKEILRI